MAVYPTFGKDVAMMDKIMANYPPELMAAFGMNQGLSLSTVLGFLVFTFVFVQLCLAIQASNYGFSFLSVEEREYTADFLMTKPVSRQTIIVQKFLAAFLALVLTNVIVWIGTYAAVELFRDGNTYDLGKLILLLSSTLLFQMFFISVGMLISVSLKKIRSVLSYSMALAFGLYVVNAIRNVIGGELLGLVSPFYHFDPGYILDKGSYNTPLVAISLVVIVGSMVTSYVLYIKRNIHSL
jgi:ABC-2 type transport system permease protein